VSRDAGARDQSGARDLESSIEFEIESRQLVAVRSPPAPRLHVHLVFRSRSRTTCTLGLGLPVRSHVRSVRAGSGGGLAPAVTYRSRRPSRIPRPSSHTQIDTRVRLNAIVWPIAKRRAKQRQTAEPNRNRTRSHAVASTHGNDEAAEARACATHTQRFFFDLIKSLEEPAVSTILNRNLDTSRRT
jgi:hypothetical protein